MSWEFHVPCITVASQLSGDIKVFADSDPNVLQRLLFRRALRPTAGGQEGNGVLHDFQCSRSIAEFGFRNAW